MNHKNKKEYILDGLNCSNCAINMEVDLNKLNSIEKAEMNFITKTLTVKTKKNEDVDKIYNDINKIVKSHEPDVYIQEKTISKPLNKELKRNLINEKYKYIEFGIGFFIFLFSFVVDFGFTINLILHITAYVIVGRNILLSAFRNIIRIKPFDENFLMVVATIGAFAIGEYSEGVAVIIFYRIGEYFQERAVNKSRRSISDLMDTRPDSATLIKNDKEYNVLPDELKIGDKILVKPGEKVPIDGIVLDGNSYIDNSALTGESLPVDVNYGSEVLSGSINKNSVLLIEVTKKFSESTAAKILDLVQNASSKKSKTENFITKFARYYTPVVLFIAVLLALIPPLIFYGEFSEWIHRALIFLVVSCPCALVISIPLGFFGGIGGASRNGILIKGSNYLEALNNVDTIVFDKTGTLTKGKFVVNKIVPMDKTEEYLLKVAAYAGYYSNHPIAISIKERFGRKIDKSIITNYEEIAGFGTKIRMENINVLIGSEKFFNKEKVNFDPVKEIGTVVYIAENNRYLGYILISDEVKSGSKDAIGELEELNVRNIIMLTGDNKEIAKSMADKLNIIKTHAGLMPYEKVEIIEKIKKEKLSKGNIIFVGDGINDVPSLASSDIGIAMGGLGSDAAIEAADIVLMDDDILKIPKAIKIAKKTKKIVWQSISFALTVKIIVLLMGAIGIVTMWEAVFADVGVALIAITNSMRLIK